MKRVSIFLAIIIGGLLVGACNKDKSETEPGQTAKLPGDNLDLYAVLDLFKKSKTLEGFEKALNDKSNKVNNLDLNLDGKVDYIKVIDHKDGDDHAITLRIPVSKEEAQDVAVIEIEKAGDQQAHVQIIGDEELYGKDFIIEPKDEKAQVVFTTVAVNVWYWPCVTYIYSPAYVVYASPWEYEYYPVWYDPWEPVAYEVYYPVVYHYHSYYYPVGHPRFEHAHHIYHENRVVSGYVHEQHHNGYYGPRQGNRNAAPNNNGQNGVAPVNRNGAPRGNNGDNNVAPRGNRAAPGGNHNAREPKPGNNNAVQRQNNNSNARQNNNARQHQNNSGQQNNSRVRSPQPGPGSHGNGNRNGNNNGGYRRSSNPPAQHSSPQQRGQNSPRPNVGRNPSPNGGRQQAPAPRPQSQPPHGGRPGPRGGH